MPRAKKPASIQWWALRSDVPWAIFDSCAEALAFRDYWRQHEPERQHDVRRAGRDGPGIKRFPVEEW